MLDVLKIRELFKDADALLGLLALALLLLIPDSAYARVAADPILFGGILSVILGGRYAVRRESVKGASEVLTADAAGMPSPESNPPVPEPGPATPAGDAPLADNEVALG